MTEAEQKEHGCNPAMNIIVESVSKTFKEIVEAKLTRRNTIEEPIQLVNWEEPRQFGQLPPNLEVSGQLR